MTENARSHFVVSSQFQPVVRQVGIDADSVFDDPRIQVWRTLPDRENCTLDEDLPDGVHVRWHVKRYQAPRGSAIPAEEEIRGHRFLLDRGIPTAPLVGYGKLPDRRSFVIFDDLTGYKPADKLVEAGTDFETLLEPTADLAAMLHSRELHHRDLYLCHFMARIIGGTCDVKLIDPARVRPLPGFLTRRRWIVKDLAQFWYSTLRLAVTEAQRSRWLARYAVQAGRRDADSLRRSVERKARSIGRHDVRLHERRPERDRSIPS